MGPHAQSLHLNVLGSLDARQSARPTGRQAAERVQTFCESRDGSEAVARATSPPATALPFLGLGPQMDSLARDGGYPTELGSGQRKGFQRQLPGQGQIPTGDSAAAYAGPILHSLNAPYAAGGSDAFLRGRFAKRLPLRSEAPRCAPFTGARPRVCPLAFQS